MRKSFKLPGINLNFGVFFICVVGTLQALSPTWASEPVSVYLTWREDPTSTMVIHWHSADAENAIDSVSYAEADVASEASAWVEMGAWSRSMLGSDRIIHMTALGGLNPATRYAFRFADDGELYYFETLPERLEEQLRFVVGGDSAPYPLMADMCREAAAQDPHFAVIGGDIAYGNADPALIERWYAWFEWWHNNMIAPDGRLIPVVVGIGNHEVAERYVERGATYASAPYLFSLFAFPGLPGYNVLDFGDYLSLFMLDTGHVNEIPGRQTKWLRQLLAERQEQDHIIPVYHVPGYPSHRDFDGRLQTEVRTHWVPLFERAGVRMAFENHDHTFKRTHPIRAGEVDETGIIYLGDGAWSVDLREPEAPEDVWYLEKTESRHHVFVVTLEDDSAEVQALDPTGELFDKVVITNPGVE